MGVGGSFTHGLKYYTVSENVHIWSSVGIFFGEVFCLSVCHGQRGHLCTASVGVGTCLALPQVARRTRAAGWVQAEGPHRLCWEACRLVAHGELSVLVVAPEAGRGGKGWGTETAGAGRGQAGNQIMSSKAPPRGHEN